MIFSHFFLIGGYLPYSYAFHCFNVPFLKLIPRGFFHNTKGIFLPLLYMWEGMILYSLQVSSAHTSKSTFALGMLTSSFTLTASQRRPPMQLWSERQGPREVFIWESSRDQKIPEMYSVKWGSDTRANNPLWEHLPVSPFWTSRSRGQWKPSRCLVEWLLSGTPVQRGNQSPGSCTAQRLILPGTLYLLHKGDRAALDVSTTVLSVSHLNHVRGSEKEKWCLPGRGAALLSGKLTHSKANLGN